MQREKTILLFSLIVVLVVSACTGSSAGGDPVESNPAGSSQLTLDQAQQVAETFLQGWRNSDYAAMYGLISPNARDGYSEPEFTEAYTETATALTLSSLDSQVKNSLRQGTTAAVLYDITFHTNLFGDVADVDRTMRLIETPEGWRVAWSPMDIFAELVEGARLNLQRTMPGRGNIYDRNGNVMVDQNGRAVTINLVKQNIPDLPGCITLLSRLLVREYKDIEAFIAPYNLDTRFPVGELDPDTFTAEAGNLLQLCAIGDDDFDTSTRTTRRYYGDLAPHVLGYVSQITPEQMTEYTAKGYPADALIGQEGIEQTYEEQLAGKIGARLTIVAPTGEVLRVIAEHPAEAGMSVYLTLDRDLQEGVQRAFVEAYDLSQATWAPKSPGAAAIVMDVRTGEILAMASYPYYQPGLFHRDTPYFDRAGEIGRLQTDWRRPLLNRATLGQYPAGSVFKIISLAAGLDSGVYNENITTSCSGTWYGADRGDSLPLRTDWLKTGHGGGVNAHWGLTWSCDPYFWDLGVALHNADPTLLERYAKMMGLGVSTGMTDLAETTGVVPDEEYFFRLNGRSWAMADTLNMVIGQGQLQITPLQIVRMVAAIANGGSLYKPLLVNRVQHIGEQPAITNQPTVITQLNFKPIVFQTIQESMCDVTMSVNGTARYVYELWYDYQGTNVIVCGKTGTAQTGGEGVAPQAWFTAFTMRAGQPEIAIAVIVENSCEGSEVAAPIVRRIVEDYYGYPHSDWPPLWQSGCVPLGE